MSLSSNQVVLYKDDNFTSQSYTIDLTRYQPGVVQSISGTDMQDKATFLRYNLPVGRVVTLIQNYVTLDMPDLKGAGKVCDLIGDGQEHEIDLRQYNMNDCVSAFVWRDVDPSQGYVTLYENSNFAGARTSLFLSEWPSGNPQSMDGWYIEDKASSIEWHDKLDTLNMTLYENQDGSGKYYANIIGRNGSIADLKTVGFNDMATSFELSRLIPEKEIIQEVNINDITPQSISTTTLVLREGENASNNPYPLDFTYSDAVTEATSVTVTDTHSAGGALEYSYEWKTLKGDNSLTLQLSYNYEHSESNTKSMETSQAVSTSDHPTADPQSLWLYKWLSETGKVDVKFDAKATRWYKQPVDGGVPDQGLYKRDEIIPGSFKGTMLMRTYSKFENPPETESDI
ncbi:MAG: hypothetical protein HC927_11705 [Deltaproteobacteria bacterium]|nr:hypothetical protein [Deltaproteobacteria bacterium]